MPEHPEFCRRTLYAAESLQLKKPQPDEKDLEQTKADDAKKKVMKRR